MRIRKRPNPSPASLPLSPPLPPLPHLPPPVPDPSQGQDGGKDNNGADRVRGTQRLHSDGDLKIHCTPPTPPPPRSEPHLNFDGSSRKTTGAAPRSDLGLLQVLRKNAKEEDGMVDANQRWNAQVYSKPSSSAPLLAEERLGDAELLEKKRRGGKPAEKEKKPKWKGSAKMMSNSANTNSCSGDVCDNARCEGEMEERVGAANGKKRRSPAVLMEGSRCSRVNGRGWRCCQQTLVGYSLCEHHLGKGRLRSMTSVRGQLGTTNGGGKLKVRSTQEATLTPRSSQKDEKVEEKTKPWPPSVAEIKMEENEAEKATQLMARRKKIGMVKARTISSLLDEENYPVPSSLSSQPSAEVAFMPTLDGSEAMV
ncbi:hypothetical protein Cni_G28969 [Canna indica]|uniref:WRC domain-containing protein n=1 Tax=Canna indica TaxID=4628 RepID=A0AAQ3L6E1_9LILI|nr:hypothetical protein Cni_G28969 [Canna indica]